MKTNEADRCPAPRQGSAWPWILGVGCALVILIGMLLPRQAGRSRQPGSAAPPGGATAGQSGNARTGLRPHPFTGAGAGPTAEEIVRGKVVRFARNRSDIVQAMARRYKVDVPDEVRRFFDAVQAGRLEEADALYKALKVKRDSADRPPGLEKLWPAVMETYGIAQQARLWPAQRLLDYGNTVLDSLSPGMIYVGGTDCGRFIPTLLNETSDAGQRIILTQNGLADGAYLDYLRFLYGDQMAMLTPEECQHAYADYLADYQARLAHDQQFPDEPSQIRPGEGDGVRVGDDGQLRVYGPTSTLSVMAINELLLHTLMQKNPDAAFALEESFPMKSTYAGATTLGPIMVLGNQDAEAALTPQRADQSLDYWRTAAQDLLSDPDSPQGSAPRDSYSKLLVSQANLFLDRDYSGQAEEALRLATQLAPASPEAVYNYTGLLAKEGRFAEARALVQNALTLAPANQGLQNLLANLSKHQ